MPKQASTLLTHKQCFLTDYETIVTRLYCVAIITSYRSKNRKKCHDNLLKKYSYTKGITFSSVLDEIINLLNVLNAKQND